MSLELCASVHACVRVYVTSHAKQAEQSRWMAANNRAANAVRSVPHAVLVLGMNAHFAGGLGIHWVESPMDALDLGALISVWACFNSSSSCSTFFCSRTTEVHLRSSRDANFSSMALTSTPVACATAWAASSCPRLCRYPTTALFASSCCFGDKPMLFLFHSPNKKEEKKEEREGKGKKKKKKTETKAEMASGLDIKRNFCFCSLRRAKMQEKRMRGMGEKKKGKERKGKGGGKRAIKDEALCPCLYMRSRVRMPRSKSTCLMTMPVAFTRRRRFTFTSTTLPVLSLRTQ